jgi:hypothetical protein
MNDVMADLASVAADIMRYSLYHIDGDAGKFGLVGQAPDLPRYPTASSGPSNYPILYLNFLRLLSFSVRLVLPELTQKFYFYNLGNPES